jgi:hypothetical protein
VALAHAVSGDQIWVAMGTYTPTTGTNQSVSFLLKNGVAIYGGFAGGETALSNTGMTHINRLGTTPLRMRFKLADTNYAADYITLYSGEATLAANRPTLTVYYNP